MQKFGFLLFLLARNLQANRRHRARKSVGKDQKGFHKRGTHDKSDSSQLLREIVVRKALEIVRRVGSHLRTPALKTGDFSK